MIVRTRLGKTTLKSRKVEAKGFSYSFSPYTFIFLVRLVSHIYVNYQIDKTKKLARLLFVEEMSIPVFQILAGSGYLQHGERVRWSSHSLPYHTYLVRLEQDL